MVKNRDLDAVTAMPGSEDLDFLTKLVQDVQGCLDIRRDPNGYETDNVLLRKLHAAYVRGRSTGRRECGWPFPEEDA